MEMLLVFALGVAVGHFGVAKLIEWVKAKVGPSDPAA